MKKTKSLVIISILVVVVTISATIYGTYSLWNYISENNANVNTLTHGLDYYINYAKGQDISSSTLNLSSNYTGGNSATIELWKKDDTYNIYGHIYLDVKTIGNNLKNEEALKWTLVSNNIVISSGTLKGSNAGSSILLKADIPLTTTKRLFTVYIWLDENTQIVEDISEEPLSVKVRAEATMKKINTGAAYITNLYNSVPKTVVTNNSIEYNYAPSVNLMNDRLGGTTTSLDGGNIRYYGANPNNYIYFNCDDYSNQSSSTCELWRIIGVFDGKVKIIRNESIGDYAWDENYSNDWSQATLKTFLNGEYYDGLKNGETRNMIAKVTWNLGGWNDSEIYSNEIYEYERGAEKCSECTYDTMWPGNIVLMYPSDYGYATDFNSCSKTLYNYGTDTNCTGNDWLFNSVHQWLLTPDSGTPDFAWVVDETGYVYSYSDVDNVTGVFPVLYLNSEQVIEAGDGSSSQPYRLGA